MNHDGWWQSDCCKWWLSITYCLLCAITRCCQNLVPYNLIWALSCSNDSILHMFYVLLMSGQQPATPTHHYHLGNLKNFSWTSWYRTHDIKQRKTVVKCKRKHDIRCRICHHKSLWHVLCKSTSKMLSDDTHIVLLPKKAMGNMMPSLWHVTYTMWQYLKNTSRWYPYGILP